MQLLELCLHKPKLWAFKNWTGGPGTVDTTAHEVLKTDRIREIHQARGGAVDKMQKLCQCANIYKQFFAFLWCVK